MLSTAQVLEPFHTLPVGIKPLGKSSLTHSKYDAPLDPYLPLLFNTDPPLLLPQYLPLLKLYSQHLEKAHFSTNEPSQADYEDSLRVVAVIMAEIQKFSKLDLNSVENSNASN